MKTLNVIYSLNFFERYNFKRLLEKNIDFKWGKSSNGFTNFFDSDKGYILSMTSTSLRITFFDNTSKKIQDKILEIVFSIVKSKFNVSDFLIEEISDDRLEIIEV